MTRRRLSIVGLLVVLALPTTAQAQPYRPVDRRALPYPGPPGGDDLPPREALDLAYRAQLSGRQFDRAIARASATGDPSLISDLWRVARAYSRTGSFGDQIFEALRRVGESDEAFIAEAERVAPILAPQIPLMYDPQTEAEMLEAEAISAHRVYLSWLIQAAAARPDSTFLPRVDALGAYNGNLPKIYRDALRFAARLRALPLPERLQRAAASAGGAYVPAVQPGVTRGSHEFSGVVYFGQALNPEVVQGREYLAAAYAENPAAVEAAIEESVAGMRSSGDADRLRAYLLQVATLPPPLPAAPLCDGQPATVYVGADGRIVGGPLAGQPYAGRLLGSDANDVLLGTSAPDLLDGAAGDDTLCGLAGDDALIGGPGQDAAQGSTGTDGCDAETPTACEGPVPALADVRPILECVAPIAGDPAGRLRAYFGYENRTVHPGRVAYGPTNRITPAAYDRLQPEAFALPGVVAGREGRTPFYPGHAFTVDFAPSERVVWKLFSRTSTASSTSTRCAE